MEYTVREIERKDDKTVEKIIRDCLVEYGGNHEGTAWSDPDLGRFSEIYRSQGNKYWVAENEKGEILGGVGIGAAKGEKGLCELQKMYCVPSARGTGVARKLIETALCYAAEYYDKCYLETLSNMTAAQNFYEKYGFQITEKPLFKTGHFACDVLYFKDLT